MSSAVKASDIRELLRTRPFQREEWSRVLGPDCHMRIGCEAPVIGREAVLRRLSLLVASTKGLGSGYFQAWTRKQDIFLEAEFECFDSALLPIFVPCAIVVRSLGGLVRDIRIYADRELIDSGRGGLQH